MIATVDLFTICHHESCHSIISYLPYPVYYIPMSIFKTGSLYLLISLIYFTLTPIPLLSANQKFVPCIYEHVSV